MVSRHLRSRPGSAAVVVLTLIVGILSVSFPDVAASRAVEPSADNSALGAAIYGLASQAPRLRTVRLRAAARQLPVARERRAGYERDHFRLWVDADGDCQDTRDEVLAAESRTHVSGCDITRGTWSSYYDGRVWRSSSDVDIDHLVPLAEAWDSGARRWNPDTRQRYANDLGDRRALVAVTDNVNQSKSDQDIAEWQPEHGRCRYVREWVAVKTRWSLTVDVEERRTLQRRAGACRNVVLDVTRAPVVLGGGGHEPQPLGRVQLLRVVYDPPGADTDNAETVTLVNRGAEAAQLDGFRLRDAAGAAYRFPAYRLGSDATVVLHSGRGAQRSGHLYAGWGATWNNDGDTARLLEPGGRLADRCSWSGDAGSVTC